MRRRGPGLTHPRCGVPQGRASRPPPRLRAVPAAQRRLTPAGRLPRRRFLVPPEHPFPAAPEPSAETPHRSALSFTEAGPRNEAPRVRVPGGSSRRPRASSTATQSLSPRPAGAGVKEGERVRRVDAQSTWPAPTQLARSAQRSLGRRSRGAPWAHPPVTTSRSRARSPLPWSRIERATGMLSPRS